MRQLKRGLRAAIAMACTAAFAAGAQAQTPQVPPGGQPGAQQPRDITPALPVVREPFAFNIPPVIERPLGAEAGPRIFVNRFVVESVLDDPQGADLSPDMRERIDSQVRAAVDLVERERFLRQRQDEIGPDGFSDDERQRVIEFMERITRDLNPDRSLEEYQRLVDDIRMSRQERASGLTIGQIAAIADEVTNLYRQNGYILARAIVPAQDVRDGVVTIRVLEGRLGRAHAENNEMYSAQVLTWPFAELEGGMIHIREIEAALLTLGDMPGVQAFGTFRPGEDVGTADIVIGVQSEERWGINSRLDNHGTRFTGRFRAQTNFTVNNPLGVGDSLNLNLMRTYRPKNTLLGSLSYSAPVLYPETRLKLDLSRNAFDISSPQLQGVDLGGLSESATLGVEHAFLRSRQASVYGQFDIARKVGETDQSGNVFNRDELAVLGLQVRYDLIDAEANAIESGFVRVDRGLEDVMGVPTNQEALNPPAGTPRFSRLNATPQFTKMSMGFSRLTAVRPGHTLLMRFAGQYTRDRLTSLEQFSMGGPNQLRALASSSFLADSGAFASVEWIVQAPGFADKEGPGGRLWGDILSVGLFVDHTRGWTTDPLPGTETPNYKFTGYGLSLSFMLPGTMNLRIQHARLAGGARPGTGPRDPNRVEDSYKTWFELGYTFR